MELIYVRTITGNSQWICIQLDGNEKISDEDLIVILIIDMKSSEVISFVYYEIILC